MHVVLQKDIKGVGHKGDVALVKPGYFRNFLLPRGLALLATAGLVAKTAKDRQERVMRREELKKKAVEIREKLASATVTAAMKTTAKGKLYGSVDEKMIAVLLQEQMRIEIDPAQVQMEAHIKAVGEYVVNLALTDQVQASFKLVVEAKKEE